LTKDVAELFTIETKNLENLGHSFLIPKVLLVSGVLDSDSYQLI
jgi:hypothetical protein